MDRPRGTRMRYAVCQPDDGGCDALQGWRGEEGTVGFSRCSGVLDPWIDSWGPPKYESEAFREAVEGIDWVVVFVRVACRVRLHESSGLLHLVLSETHQRDAKRIQISSHVSFVRPVVPLVPPTSVRPAGRTGQGRLSDPSLVGFPGRIRGQVLAFCRWGRSRSRGLGGAGPNRTHGVPCWEAKEQGMRRVECFFRELGSLLK